jgi:DNA-binding GntR family transcriptional regulator
MLNTLYFCKKQYFPLDILSTIDNNHIIIVTLVKEFFMKFPSLKKDNSLSEKVYQAIYKQILSGRVTPGDRMTELELSNSMGVSRPPVREALKRLTEDRLVVLVPRSGCFVANLKPEEIEEIHEIRKRLECMALQFAFDNFNLAQLEDLKERFLALIKFNPQEMVKKEVKLDAKFHKLIIESANCPNLKEMLDKLRARVEVFRIKEANYIYRAQHALQEHVNILNSIISNDKTKAIQELENHIEHTKQNVLKNLKE